MGIRLLYSERFLSDYGALDPDFRISLLGFGT